MRIKFKGWAVDYNGPENTIKVIVEFETQKDANAFLTFLKNGGTLTRAQMAKEKK